MSVEVLDSQNSSVRENSLSNTEEKMLRGGLLDMWRLYQYLSPTPNKLSDLTFFDTLSARDGLLFPDFFNAVHRFLVPSRFSMSRVSQKPHPEGIDSLKTELDETFTAINSRWESYGPFFDRHPELRYLRELSFRAGEVKEFGAKLPFLRGIEANHLWSIVEYHHLRGNLDCYVALDAAISRNQGIGTLFEENIATYPGDFRVYLLPYGKAADRIAKYLPLLKHGDLIGFGTVALAEVNGRQFIAVTSLQTDLLRKDHASEVVPETIFAYCKVKKNSDGKYTVPGGISRRYLARYDWAHRLVSAVENAVLEISERIPIAGVIMPTLSTYGTIEFDRLSRSQYASGLYESFPGEHAYHQLKISPAFPLTEQWEKGAISGSGTWWVKSTSQLKSERNI